TSTEPTSPPPTTSTEPTSPPPTPTDPTPTGEGPSSDRPSASENDGHAAADSLAKQQEDIEDVTAILNREKGQVPEPLQPTVAKLTAILHMFGDPKKSPKEREEVIRSTERVTSALETINAPETPHELRTQLTEIVKQVTSALEVSLDSKVPPEERVTLAVIAERLTSALDVVSNPRTPYELRKNLIRIERKATSTLMSLRPGMPPERQDEIKEVMDWVGVAVETIRHPRTPEREREELAKSAQQVSSSLEQIASSGASEEERARAQKALGEQSARMKKQQERAASAQGLPDVQLGEATKVCTDAIFRAQSDHALNRTLAKLFPDRWKEIGVEDFWKVTRVGEDYVDLLVWLQNGQHADAPFRSARIITRLATLVPAGRLFGTIGIPALYCLQAAWHLDQHMGITAGTWLKMAIRKKSEE
ncbi:hypothetical protein, partial [Streptomyces sp. GC420]|uniref:hypothetical protein n=1 Tax=Streptomyces sp. GC420 TaxID=2697568 RepID=UPI001AA0BC89